MSAVTATETVIAVLRADVGEQAAAALEGMDVTVLREAFVVACGMLANCAATLAEANGMDLPEFVDEWAPMLMLIARQEDADAAG